MGHSPTVTVHTAFSQRYLKKRKLCHLGGDHGSSCLDAHELTPQPFPHPIWHGTSQYPLDLPLFSSLPISSLAVFLCQIQWKIFSFSGRRHWFNHLHKSQEKDLVWGSNPAPSLKELAKEIRRSWQPRLQELLGVADLHFEKTPRCSLQLGTESGSSCQGAGVPRQG